MKKIFISLTFILSTFFIYSQADTISALSEEQKNKSIEVVENWIKEMFKADDINSLMQISDVPFAFDRKDILTNIDDLRKIYQRIFENKGYREIPNFEVMLLDYKLEIIDNYIPVNSVNARVIINGDDKYEYILVNVAICNDTYKVIGFYD